MVGVAELRTVVEVQGQLELDGIPDELVRVTPARLGLWEGCPRRYRMRYLDRPAGARSGPWAHSTLGAVVHHVLHAFFELPAARRTPGEVRALLRSSWKNDGFRDAAQAAEQRERAAGWLSDYVADVEHTPVAVERWVSARCRGLLVQGRVDRIDDRDGELVVVDYKTGRCPPSETAARDSLALALYACAAGKTWHRRCRRVELHHLPTGRVVSWDHTEDTLAEQLDRAERLAGELRDANAAIGGQADGELAVHFPAKPGRACATCEFRSRCAEGRQAATRPRPWDLLGI